MFGFIEKTIKAVFGSKHEKDIKEIMPLVNLTIEEYAKLQSLSNDELRAKTSDFKARINDYVSEYDNQINSLRKQASETEDVEDKDKIYNEVDKLIIEKDKHLEDILLTILPEAFAVVKETAKRFTENESLEVSATELDKKLALKLKNIQINGDKATYSNRWTPPINCTS